LVFNKWPRMYTFGLLVFVNLWLKNLSLLPDAYAAIVANVTILKIIDWHRCYSALLDQNQSVLHESFFVKLLCSLKVRNTTFLVLYLKNLNDFTWIIFSGWGGCLTAILFFFIYFLRITHSAHTLRTNLRWGRYSLFLLI
jgi:hypothetical protein